MADEIYIIYENDKKKIEPPIDYDDLYQFFKKEFNEEGEKDDYVFKIKNENGNEEEIEENVESEFFERDLEIYATKKKKDIKDFGIYTSQFEPKEKSKEKPENKPKEKQNEIRIEEIEEIILDKNDDNNKSKEDFEIEYKNFVNKNIEKTDELSKMREKRDNMKKELEKLKEELENIKKKPKKKKLNITNYQIKLKKLKEELENKKNKLEEDLSNIKKLNKKMNNKIEQLKLGNKQENEMKSNLNNEQSELITRKNNMLSQALEKKKFKFNK